LSCSLQCPELRKPTCMRPERHGTAGKVATCPVTWTSLVVGGADDDDLFDIAHSAKRTLGREVNIRWVSAQAWQAPASDSFVASLRSHPLVRLDLSA
jgi:hypothetical protein